MRFEDMVGAAVLELLLGRNKMVMVLRELTPIADDHVIVKGLVNHCLYRLALMLVTIAFDRADTTCHIGCMFVIRRHNN